MKLVLLPTQTFPVTGGLVVIAPGVLIVSTAAADGVFKGVQVPFNTTLY